MRRGITSRLAMTGEELATRVLYRDGLMLVIDKPAGIASIAARKAAKSRRLFFCAALWLARNPALVHRLDRDTSGCLGARGGTTRRSKSSASCSSKARSPKTYWASWKATRRKTKGMIVLPLGRRDPVAAGG